MWMDRRVLELPFRVGDERDAQDWIGYAQRTNGLVLNLGELGIPNLIEKP